MVRPPAVTLALAALLTAVAVGAAEAIETQKNEAANQPVGRRLEALLTHLAATAPGTYLLKGTALEPAPEDVRIPALLQADALKGPERAARVGIVVGADVPQAAEVRLHVSTAAAGKESGRFVADAGGSGAPGPLRLVREFSMPPGEYDVEAVVGYARPDSALVVAVAKARVAVPDIRGGSLAVTPVVAGEATTTAHPAALPFIFGRTILTPAVSPLFSQDGHISVAFRVYNWTAQAEEKPDLTVEYLFYEQGTKGLHLFNKVKPQLLNATTLGAAFEPAAGSVAAGVLIPLGSFTFGEFQLVVKVTDNRSQKSAERELRFTVAP